MVVLAPRPVERGCGADASVGHRDLSLPRTARPWPTTPYPRTRAVMKPGAVQSRPITPSAEGALIARSKACPVTGHISCSPHLPRTHHLLLSLRGRHLPGPVPAEFVRRGPRRNPARRVIEPSTYARRDRPSAAVDSSRSKGYHRVSLKPWAVCQTKSHCKPSAIQVVRQSAPTRKGPNDYSLELRCHNETHDRTLLVVLGSHV